MAALATAFACVWITVALYVGWIGRKQRQLAARLQELSALMAELREAKSLTRKAA